MERELGTERRDVPHRFLGQLPLCKVCGADADDRRHARYKEIADASRVTAAQQDTKGYLRREHG